MTWANPSGGTSPYGTLKIENTGLPAGTLQFTITIDPQFGTNRDVHELGFNLDGGPLAALPTATKVTAGSYSITVESNKKLSAQPGNDTFDYRVTFGNGTPYINPMVFKLTGTGLSLDLFTPTATTNVGNNNNPVLLNFGVHVQSTGTLSTGSMFLGGEYGGISNPPSVPEPLSLGLMATGMACSALVLRRRRS